MIRTVIEPPLMRLLLITLFVLCVSVFSYATNQQSTLDSLLEKIKTTEGITKAKNYNLAASILKLSKPDTALILAKQALEIGTKLNDDLTNSEALGNIAECFSYQSLLDSAVTYYVKAVKLSEKLNNTKKMASYYNGMGIVFYQLGDYEKSISYLKKAADIKYKEGDMLYYTTINCNISAILQRRGKFNEAIALLLDSEKKLKNFDKVEILANLYNTLGSAYQLGKKNLDSAEYYYAKNIALISKPEHEAFRLAAYLNIGQLYIESKQYDRAEFNLMKALDLSISLSRKNERIHAYENLSNLYEAKQDYKNALYYKNLQTTLRDSIFNVDREKLIQDLENKYQLEKKDLQISGQELIIQKEKNKKTIIIFLAFIVALLLTGVAFYFWLKKRSRESLEKTKSRLFQNIAHEVRTPLTLINGPLSVLKQELQNDRNKAQFDLIEKNSEKLVLLLDELLVASKLEREDFKTHYLVGDIVLFTKNLTDNFYPEAEKNKVSLHFICNKESFPVSFPANAYEKIVNNLISNAIKYNKPEGSVTVHLQLTGNTLSLEVKDNGIGMTKAEKENIFTRFYRAETQKSKPGFGVGMAVVKELTDLLKGTIEIQSEPGKGTIVLVNITLQESTEDATKINTIETTDNDFVLIAEDDDGIYDFIHSILSKEGIQTMRAKNGREGASLAIERIPTLVITDVMMPVEDGISMTKTVKTNELTRHIPVLMLSAKTSVESRLQGVHAGADLYLGKPFNPEELVALVKNSIQTQIYNREKYAVQLEEPAKSYKERVAGNDDYLKKIVAAVEEHILETDFSVNELASVMCISRSQLHRKITALTNLSTTHFIRIIRLEKAKDMLLTNSGNVTEIAYSCGFNSQSYFSKSFAEHFGKPPSEFVK